MTAITKTSVKAYFVVGAKPSAAQFGDLVDSYQDAHPLLAHYGSAGGAGKLGFFMVTGSGTGTFVSGGGVVAGLLPQTSTTQTVFGLGGTTIGTRILHVAATASAQGHIGAGTVGAAIFESITQTSAQTAIGFQAAAVQGAGRGIELRTLSVTQVALQATEIVLKDVSGNSLLASNVSANVAITGTGAGGLDTGAEAANTMYAVWAIGSAGGSSGVLSTNFTTGPTLPAGWTYRAFVGAVYNDPAQNFESMHQKGAVAACSARAVFASATGVTSLTAVDLSAQCPPNAAAVRISVGVAAAATQRAIAVASNGNRLGMQWGTTGSNNLVDGFAGATTFEVVVATAQTVYWRAEAADVNTYRMSINGWRFPQ